MLSKAERSSFIKDVLPILRQFLVDLNTPLSLGIFLLISSGTESDWDAVANLEFSPHRYLESDIDLCDRDYQAYNLCRKLPNILGRDLKQVAFDGFWKGEGTCNEINLRVLDGSLHQRLADLDLPTFEHIRAKIARVLGKAPSWKEVYLAGGWGPGSSVSLSYADASPETKCEYGLACTYRLASTLSKEWSLNGTIFDRAITLVPGNIVTTVPKSLKTDRTIAIEPDVNSWFQKGVGSYIRSRLKRWSIDLDDQTLNQRAALMARDAGFSTIDLKNASNSISCMLAIDLLPEDWAHLVWTSRSERGTFDSRTAVKNCAASWFEYEMVSSMGNGFTFELESLLFFSFCLAVGSHPGDTYIYGDDIVVRQELSGRLVELLEVLGFGVNNEKSFFTGNFYESCGIHVFCNRDVTPINVKDLHHETSGKVQLANKLRAWAHRRCSYYGCDRRALSAWRLCLDRIPRHARRSLRAPYGCGISIWSNPNEMVNRYSRKRGGLAYQVLVPRLRTTEGAFPELLGYRISQITGGFLSVVGVSAIAKFDPVKPNGNIVISRGTGRYKRMMVYIEGQYDMGPWLTLGMG